MKHHVACQSLIIKIRIHFNIITKDGIEERRLPLRRD